MNENTAQEPEPSSGEGPIAGAGMTDEAELIFRDWLESLTDQDIRYDEKVIGLLVRAAMVDDRLRAQVLEDPEGALHALGSSLSLPEEFTVRFSENTSRVLNVVLPPRAEAVATYFDGWARDDRLVALRERLQSRTADFPTLFKDNWNLHDAGNDLSFGMIVPPA
jgi:hypothetical protein